MKYGDLTIHDAVAVFGILNGRKGVDALLSGREVETAKYGEMTLGQNEALLNILGGMEVVKAVLNGEMGVALKQAVIKLFDKNGRRIPPRTLQANVSDSNPDYRLVQPTLDYSERFGRLMKYLLFNHTELSREDFKNRAEAVLERLQKDDSTKALLNGVHLPFCLSKLEVVDYGKTLDDVFLPAVGTSYKQQFPERDFNNYRQGELEGQVTIVPGSRHEELVAAMARGPVVGIYFPNCLQGFSVDADREQMPSLPEHILLAGGFEALACMIAYPDVLARDRNTPLLDLAALQWQSADYALHFYARDDDAYFSDRGDHDHAVGYYTGGLAVLG